MLSADWQEQGKKISQVIAKAWLDPEFQQQLVANPVTVLQEYQVQIPEGLEVQLDPSSFHWQIVPSPDGDGAIFKIPLPPKPNQIEDETLIAWCENRAEAPPYPLMPKT